MLSRHALKKRQGQGESVTSPRRLQAADRQRQALEMRKDGHTFEAIAKALAYQGRSSAYRAVMAGLQKTLQEPADELRKLELERLDKAAAAIVGRVEDGDLQAIDRWIRISESRRKLLGLDGPAKVDITSVSSVVSISLVDYTERSDDELRTVITQQCNAGAGQPDAGETQPD